LSNLLRGRDSANDDGPFVIDLRQQITRLREALDEATANEANETPESRSPLYSVEFLLQTGEALFERIVRLADLLDSQPVHGNRAKAAAETC
jgi:hypothetical protein